MSSNVLRCAHAGNSAVDHSDGSRLARSATTSGRPYDRAGTKQIPDQSMPPLERAPRPAGAPQQTKVGRVRSGGARLTRRGRCT
jgi:hypothetical protein